MQKIRQRDKFKASICFFEKALYEVRASGQHLSFNILRWSTTWTYNKSKLYKFSDC